MENPKAFNCLTLVINLIAAREDNGLDKRVQGTFLKGSFLASKIDSFIGDGVVATQRADETLKRS